MNFFNGKKKKKKWNNSTSLSIFTIKITSWVSLLYVHGLTVMDTSSPGQDNRDGALSFPLPHLVSV